MTFIMGWKTNGYAYLIADTALTTENPTNIVNRSPSEITSFQEFNK